VQAFCKREESAGQHECHFRTHGVRHAAAGPSTTGSIHTTHHTARRSLDMQVTSTLNKRTPFAFTSDEDNSLAGATILDEQGKPSCGHPLNRLIASFQSRKR
jgi:hypothetical protein